MEGVWALELALGYILADLLIVLHPQWLLWELNDTTSVRYLAHISAQHTFVNEWITQDPYDSSYPEVWETN